MLKTFPKHKDAFCPQAICKTIAPNTFRIFPFQWRCWITSTIHSLAEPVLARDLYGNFCPRYSAAWLAKSNSITVLLGTLRALSSGSWRHRLQHMIHNISIGMYRLSLLSALSSPQLIVPWLFWHGYMTMCWIELEMSETWTGTLQPLLVSMCAQNRPEVNFLLASLELSQTSFSHISINSLMILSLNGYRKPSKRPFDWCQSCLKAINIGQDIRQINW